MTGAERVWHTLRELGLHTVFGVPGGAVLPLVDALSQTEDMAFIVTRHESAAIHAADGFARAGGTPGVALVTSGPGGTNALTGLMTAMTDSTPLVVLVGQVPTGLIGTDAFQEADVFTMALPVVKHSWKVSEVDEVGRIIRAAYRVASSGRPGPVLVELPKDVQMAEESRPGPEKVQLPSEPWRLSPLEAARFSAYVRRARRPVLYVGGGVVASGVAPWIQAWAERYQVPVTTTLMGIGAFPANHPLSLGMLGMHGTFAANHAVQAADLILALGVRFDDRVTGRIDSFAPHAHIVHVEVDASERNKIVTPHLTLKGDLREVLPILDRLVPEALHDEWLETIRQWQTEHPLKVPEAPSGRLSTAAALRALSNRLNDQDVVVTDVGQHQMWAALFVPRAKPRSFITSGGAGTMGYGLPAAIGASLARAGTGRVVLIAGDGSLQMNLQELATVAQYQVPVTIVVMNNGGHGMVRQWQDLFHGRRRHGVALTNPDFVDLARVFGIAGMTATSMEELEAALEALPATQGPALLEVAIDPNEMVFPMVPSGKSLSEVIEG
ncbi:biosynthetic-type acetolactate synthase large subunit [Sulfobacillus harzensis]|uniref:Acetolactate synthase n=1 Tax=Sulfobacillus harzensis TaxID=2729629 RepID=A0A7Y0L1W2_9FIRM|nr:biosynthetic-type acetolactate synthase large subunit [Sulfobacillus harzensis]NMP21700.1 biosynthetic-type acetolactate synthase large subunit [Sulfobacillus harzensis]